MTPSSSNGLGLKKGAWSAHEDKLLKDYIEQYGEGKWHLIPRRTGNADLASLIVLQNGPRIVFQFEK